MNFNNPGNARQTDNYPTVKNRTMESVSNYKNQTNASQVEIVEEKVDAYIVIPPDGGWGWIIVMSAFTAFLISDGIFFSFGIFLQEWSDTFKCKKSQVALAGALMTGFSCLAGPFVAALVNHFGYRTIAIIGSFLASSSCFLTSITTSVYQTYITYGIIGGIGFGLMYIPALIALGFYFERWRALATGIAVCGSGVGGIVFPPLFTILIKHMGWRYTFRIMGGINLISSICGALYRPIRPVKITTINLIEKIIESESKEMDQKSFFVRFHNKQHSTVAQFLSNSRSATPSKTHSCYQSANDNTTSTVTIYRPEKLDTKISSEFVMSTTPSNVTSNSKTCLKVSKTEKTDTNLSTIYEEVKSKRECARCWKKTQSCFRCKDVCYYTRGIVDESTITRPLYRDDIFYSGSLLVLPEYRKSVYLSKGKVPTTSVATSKSKSSIDYTMQVTRTITQNEIEEMNNSETCQFCSESVKRTLATMLDYGLLKSPSFVLLTMHAVFISFAFYTPFMFIRDRAIQFGMSEKENFWLISTIGASNTLGRIVCGVLSSTSIVSANSITYTSLFIGGILTMVSGVSNSSWMQFGYATTYGFCIACLSALRTIIIVDMLGLEKLTNAIGLLSMVQGIGILSGTAFSGMLREYSGNYYLSFYFAGACITLGSLFLIPIKISAMVEEQKYETS